MKAFKVKSLDKNITDEQLELKGVRTTSFLSFERAIESNFTMRNHKTETMEDVEGYRVTEQGIEIIWK